MSTSSLGSRREYDVIDSFVTHDFWFIKANRSGQCIAESRQNHRIPGDLFLWHPQFGGFQTEVGGSGKRLIHEFAELRNRLLIGFRPLVVMFKNRRRWYYLSERDRFHNIPALLEAARSL